MDCIKVTDRVDYVVLHGEPKTPLDVNFNGDIIPFKGKWHVEHHRNGKKIAEWDFKNGIVNVGKNDALNVLFVSGTQHTTWYVGLIDNASFSAFASSDTMASHAGWIENTAYAETNRVTWTPGSSSGQSVTNGTAFTFTINSGGTLKGVFITTDNTKSGTSGVLWSTAAFPSPVVVSNGDVFKLTYTVSC